MKKMHAETLRALGRAAMRLALPALALVLVSQPPAHAQQQLREARASVEIDWSVLDQLVPVVSVETPRERTRAVGRAAGRTGNAVAALKPATSSTRLGPNSKPAKKASTAGTGRPIGAKTASRPVVGCGRPSVPKASAVAGSPKPIKPATHEPAASSAAPGGSPSGSAPQAPPSRALPSVPPLAPVVLDPPQAQPGHLPGPRESGSGAAPSSEARGTNP